VNATDFEPLAEMLARHGLTGSPEEPFPNDGWSGASMTLLRRGRDRFVLKRDSLARDWIARATADGPILREAWFAAHGPGLPSPLRAPYLGVGADGDEFAILMPDLTGILFDWDAPISVDMLERVLDGLAELHSQPWTGSSHSCPIRERITLICRASLERPGPAREAVGERILPGWDAFDRLASPAAREVINALSEDPAALVDALGRLPSTLLHGDLKLANVGITPDGAIVIIDWQMVMIAPVAIELGWFLVSNVNALPLPPADILDRYWRARRLDGTRQNDIAILVGLLLRGWRKGYDAEAGVSLASGVSAADDLAWWCDRAVEAAGRVL
jgi:hypothetical protein